MTDLTKYFRNLKLDGKAPIYQQMRELIKVLVEQFPDGAAFPSDRELSELLGINRRTIGKAFEPFVKQGTILRNNKGTVTYKNTGDDSGIHPFVFDKMRISSQKEHLKFTLYENYPVQKAFWTSTVESFNRQHTGACVDLDWLPVNISDAAGYAEYFIAMGTDIVQIPSLLDDARIIKKCLDPLPGDLTADACSDKYWIKTLLTSVNEKIDCALPVSFAFPVFVWNCDLVKKAGITAPARTVYEKGIEELFAKAEKLLSAELFLAGHVEDYLLDSGYPAEEGDKGYERFFRDQFTRVGRLPASAEKWFSHDLATYNYNISDSMILFAQRRTVFSYAYPLFFSKAPNIPVFAYRGVLPEVPEGKKMACGATGLGVHQRSRSKTVGFDFLRFVLSEEIQKQIPEKVHACATLKKGNAMPSHLMDMDEERFNALVPSLKLTSNREIRLGEVLAESRRTLFPALFERTMSVDDAVDKAMKLVRSSPGLSGEYART